MNLLTKNRANTYINNLLMKNIISVTTFVEYQWILEKDENMDLDKFYLYCITNSNVEYKNFPVGYKNNAKFLISVAKEKPSILEDLEKANQEIYSEVVSAFTTDDMEKCEKLLKKKIYSNVEQIKNEL